MAELLDMGKYAPFIWPAYGISVLVIGFVIVRTLRQSRETAARLGALEHQNDGQKDA